MGFPYNGTSSFLKVAKILQYMRQLGWADKIDWKKANKDSLIACLANVLCISCEFVADKNNITVISDLKWCVFKNNKKI
ncbi:hypothetical protein [Acinetobacter pullicarnis]|uniref:hypothetical protein n=1 Tax=Acinetobacter pullicarnis TaxID=2576829 RepID=UPI00112151BE|nr:hypothetical protein [Acinetobacter pullicarnis]